MNEEIRKSVLKYCFANCFEFPVIVNVVLIYFGIGLYAENVRHYLFVASLVVLLMIAFYAFVRVFKLKETPKSALVLYAIFLGYYIFGFAISFLKFGMTNAFKDCLPKTIIISGACFLIGYVGAKNEYGKEFLTWLEKGSVLCICALVRLHEFKLGEWRIYWPIGLHGNCISVYAIYACAYVGIFV